MTDTPTARYGARQQSQGSNTNTWGDDKLNEVERLLDRGSKGYQALAMTGDTTLSWTNYVATNDGQVAILKLTGSLSSSANLVVPSKEWVWELVWNTTGQTITMKTSAGSGVAIPNGRKVGVFCDATDCYATVPNYLVDSFTATNNRDVVDKQTLEAAIAASTIPASAGTILISATDTTAGYIGTKLSITGSGAVTVTPSITNPGANETRAYAIAAGSLGLTDGGLVAASFSAAANTRYRVPVGGTVTLPTATGSGNIIALSIYGSGTTLLSGTVNGVTGTSAYAVLGDQTLIITDADATRGWV